MGLGVRPPGVPHGTVAVGGHGMNFHGRWFDGPDALMSPAPPGPTQLAFGGMEGDASSDLDRSGTWEGPPVPLLLDELREFPHAQPFRPLE